MPDTDVYKIDNNQKYPINIKTKRVTFTIKEDILSEFNKIADKNNLNKSGVIQTLMNAFLENIKNQEIKK